MGIFCSLWDRAPQDSGGGTSPWEGSKRCPCTLPPPDFSQGRPSEQAPTFSALGLGSSFPVNSFPSERKSFVLFLFVSYPTACWFSVHFSNIHHFLVCVCLPMCVYLVCCVFLAGSEACCANAALSHPGQPLVPTPMPALVLSQAPRVQMWLAGTSGYNQGPSIVKDIES